MFSWRFLICIGLIIIILYLILRLRTTEQQTYKGVPAVNKLLADILRQEKPDLDTAIFEIDDPPPKQPPRVNTKPVKAGRRLPGEKSPSSAGERACRKTLEEIFQVPFPKDEPQFMKNPLTGRKLELDCYNKDLQLACEYNGAQHSVYTPYFHKKKEDVEKAAIRDDVKRQLCDRAGVYLITVQWYVDIKDIPTFIKKALPPTVTKYRHDIDHSENQTS